MTYVSVCQADSPQFLYLLNETSGTFADQQGGPVGQSLAGGQGASYRTALGFVGQPFGITTGTASPGLAFPNIANAAAQNVTGTSASWEFCMAYNQSLAGQPFIMGKGFDGTNGGYAIYLNTLGHLNIFVTGLGVYWDSGYVVSSDTTVRHYIVTLNGTTGTIYQNGTSVKTGTPGAGVTATASTDVYGIGAGHTSSGGWVDVMAGLIVGNVSLYNTPLSSARVTAHYNALSAATGGPTIKTAPPGQVVSELAHERNQERKTGAEQASHRHRISDYYRHHRRI